MRYMPRLVSVIVREPILPMSFYYQRLIFTNNSRSVQNFTYQTP